MYVFIKIMHLARSNAIHVICVRYLFISLILTTLAHKFDEHGIMEIIILGITDIYLYAGPRMEFHLQCIYRTQSREKSYRFA